MFNCNAPKTILVLLKKFCLIILVFQLLGCNAWTLMGGPYDNRSSNFHVFIPGEWMRNNLNESALELTRDGVNLQAIFIGRHPLEKDLPGIKKNLSASMLPSELAGAVMDGVFSGPDVFHPEILKNEPVTVDGVSGFRVLYSFKTATGLKKKGVYTGFIAEKWFYFLRYSAPEQHYFEHDLEVYDRMVRSFRLLKTPG